VKRVTRSLDESPRLRSLIQWLSNSLAAQRGVPLLAAIVLTVLSLVVHILWIATGSTLLGVVGFVVLHLAILVALIGILLAEPLGRGI